MRLFISILLIVLIILSSFIIMNISYTSINNMINNKFVNVAIVKFDKVILRNNDTEKYYDGNLTIYVYELDVESGVSILYKVFRVKSPVIIKIDLSDYIYSVEKVIRNWLIKNKPILYPAIDFYVFAVDHGRVYGRSFTLMLRNVKEIMNGRVTIRPVIMDSLVLKPVKTIPLYAEHMTINSMRRISVKYNRYVPHSTDIVGDQDWYEVYTTIQSCTNCIPKYWVETFSDDFPENGEYYAREMYKAFVEYQTFLLDDLTELPDNNSIWSLTKLAEPLRNWVWGSALPGIPTVNITHTRDVPEAGIIYKRTTSDNPYMYIAVTTTILKYTILKTENVWYTICL